MPTTGKQTQQPAEPAQPDPGRNALTIPVQVRTIQVAQAVFRCPKCKGTAAIDTQSHGKAMHEIARGQIVAGRCGGCGQELDLYRPVIQRAKGLPV